MPNALTALDRPQSIIDSEGAKINEAIAIFEALRNIKRPQAPSVNNKKLLLQRPRALALPLYIYIERAGRAQEGKAENEGV